MLFSKTRSPLSRTARLLLVATLTAATGWSPAAADDSVAEIRPLPIDEYLMADRAEEIALARSAAPPSVAEEAGVSVLGRDGYTMVEPSKNGFVCMVGRGWSAPIRFRSGRLNAEFWSPAVKAPMCMNPEAVRTIMPVLARRTELAMAGKSLGEVEADAAEQLDSGRYVAPEGVAMSYMFSPRQHLGEAVGRYLPHVMLYSPGATSAEWGCSGVLSGWPFVGESEGEPHALVIIPVAVWSDGTPVERGVEPGR